MLDSKLDFKNINFKDISAWPKNFKLLATGAFGLVIFIIGFLTLDMPQHSALSNAKKQEVELKQKLITLIPEANAKKQQLDQIKALKNMVSQYSQALPKPEELGSILENLTQSASKNQLRLSLLKPEATIQEQYYAKIPISIKATGNYFQLAKFIEYMAGLPYYIYLGKADLALTNDDFKQNKNKKAADSHLPPDSIMMDMTTELYYYAPKPKETTKGKKHAKAK